MDNVRCADRGIGCPKLLYGVSQLGRIAPGIGEQHGISRIA
jgi:hypothetical protein